MSENKFNDASCPTISDDLTTPTQNDQHQIPRINPNRLLWPLYISAQVCFDLTHGRYCSPLGLIIKS